MNIFNILKDEITIETINDLALELLANKNKILDIDFPEKESVKILNNDEIIALYEQVLNEEIDPYFEKKLLSLYSVKMLLKVLY